MSKSTSPQKAPAPRQRGVTMTDVAKHAGVSRTAVSFVLSNRANASISEETRTRINDAVQALGYRPNAGARALASQRSDWYGIVTEIVTAPFAVDIIKGAQDQAWLDRRFLLIAPSDQADAAGPNQGMEDAAIEKLLEQRVEGLLYAATYHRGVHVPRSANEVPTVLINCFDLDGNLPSIVPDERAGGRVAVERLLRAGHTRIGVINLDPDIPAAIGRLEGAREALAGAQLELNPELVVSGNATADGGYAAAAEILDRYPEKDRPTALFCLNDRMAMGAYDAIKERGLAIPGDIAVIGFDNQELIAAYLRPKLTTVALPFEKMGALGVQTLAALTAGQPITAGQQLVDCPLLERSSV
ncbi:LacI family DNA-binding transcriptional regulator [Pseudarthrobacter phenanthrenivorans]|uniref:LacI family DNA-binding transcriptional regulator n=1 Tax=Pseudarthrobacter phenanthrenivorans TaxID=361575 RepID=A0A3B0FX57_PSEPS|nr:LacI family DNA-binding transcriptional regulator [Pseudarthrobacter phenanthrenivorans]RKO24510.1 LacI family DNA-binding transcriptional regulator [Pseudarthrobacter phenanthrenivorans]